MCRFFFLLYGDAVTTSQAQWICRFKTAIAQLVYGAYDHCGGLSVLSITPFPGFRQIAVFSIVGLVSAWITSILLLPRLPPLHAEAAIRHLAWVGKVRVWFLQHTRVRYLTLLSIVVIGGVSLLF